MNLVSSHIGRRSFVTHFYGKMKTPDIMHKLGIKLKDHFILISMKRRDFDVKRKKV